MVRHAHFDNITPEALQTVTGQHGTDLGTKTGTDALDGMAPLELIRYAAGRMSRAEIRESVRVLKRTKPQG